MQSFACSSISTIFHPALQWAPAPELPFQSTYHLSITEMLCNGPSLSPACSGQSPAYYFPKMHLAGLAIGTPPNTSGDTELSRPLVLPTVQQLRAARLLWHPAAPQNSNLFLHQDEGSLQPVKTNLVPWETPGIQNLFLFQSTMKTTKILCLFTTQNIRNHFLILLKCYI